ncbi:MAG: 30S ribosomal protein S16 [Actinobacteria bacterium HGW-Actinobacteria-7]|nr:MAG: 30S ribosomal protein S16 [Actinobacteria bacterium HGW-Actinobacteria-7]
MAVKIRLARHGAKKAPFYRIVVADGRARRDGRFIEMLGRYNPRANPSLIEVDVEKVDAWVAKGAQMTETVVKLVAIARGEKVLPEGGTAKPSKKSVARAAAEVAAAEKAAADAAKAAADAAAAAEAAAAEAAAAEAAASEEVAEEAPVEESPEAADAE